MNSQKGQIEAVTVASMDWVWTSALKDWFEGESPLFWLCGKPASGKSTLMQYLCSSEDLDKYLPGWRDRWNILEFYFDFLAGGRTANTSKGM